MANPPSSERSSPRQSHKNLIIQGLLTAFFLLIVPDWKPDLIDYSSLDGSWQAVIAHLAFQDIAFGRDLVYTVGPFGWLRVGAYWPGLHFALVAWGAFVGIVLAGLSRILVQDIKGGWLIGLTLLFAAMPTIVSGKVAVMFYLVDCLVIFAVLQSDRHSNRVTMILTAVFLSLSSWVYFPQMVAATVTIVIVGLLNRVRFRTVGLLPQVFLGTLVMWWLLAGQHLSDLPSYLLTSVEVTRGFADVMSLTGPVWEILLPLLMFLIVLVLVLVSRRGESHLQTALLALGLVFLFFIAFKGAVVRQQTPRLAVPAITIFGMALAQLAWLATTESPVRRRWMPIAAAVVSATMVFNFSLVALGREDVKMKIVKPARHPIRQTRRIIHLLRKPDSLKKKDLRNRKEIRDRFPLPPIEGGVDLFGDRQGILLCHGLDYQPRPAFQRFSAYTADLAEMNGKFLASERAPETLVIDLTGFGRILRPQMDSRAFLEILQNYKHIESRGKLAVVERDVHRPFQHQPAFEITAAQGQWISIEEHSKLGPIWLQVDTRSTIRGKLAGIALKTPPLAIDLRFRDGSSSDFRFASNVARSGFWLSPTIQNSIQFVEFMKNGFKGISHDRIVSGFRIRESMDESSWAWRNFRIRVFRLVRSEDSSAPALVTKPGEKCELELVAR